MLVKLSTTGVAVQLCRFLCCFLHLFTYQEKKKYMTTCKNGQDKWSDPMSSKPVFYREKSDFP